MTKGLRTVAGRSAAALALGAFLLVAGRGAAQSALSGQALVQDKDVSRGTVTLEGRVLSVRPESDLRSRAGAPIGLEDLRALSGQKALGGALVDASRVDFVDYEGRELDGAFVLERLRVIELPH